MPPSIELKSVILTTLMMKGNEDYQPNLLIILMGLLDASPLKS
jgi:hypothetical protein